MQLHVTQIVKGKTYTVISQPPAPENQKQYTRVQQYLHQGRPDDAIALCDELTEKNPTDHYAYYLKGSIYTSLNKFSIALEHFSKALELKPDNLEYLYWYADLLRLCGHHELSEKLYRKVLEINEGHDRALFGLGLLYFSYNRWHEAGTLLKQAIDRKPSNSNAHKYYAETCLYQGKLDEALKHGKKAVSLSPKNSSSYYALANIYQVLGKKEESLKQIEKTVTLDPKNGSAHYILANSKKYTSKDLPFIKNIEKKLESGMTADSRSHFHFALAKMYNDLKDPDRAFDNLSRANLILYNDFSTKKLKTELKEIKNAFNKKWSLDHRKNGNPSEVPIFVVGMPRSGTTLIDQVLSSHSLIGSIGESSEVRIGSEEACNETGDYPPRICLAHLKPETIQKYSERYLERALIEHPNALRIVDKMPANFFALGYIYTLFPNAKIVHSKRHPLDTCLSCFFQRFTEASNMDWSNDLVALGQYYKAYLNIMDHWKANLPIEILDINYEDMVADLESNARKLIQFAGLEWEDSCLNFHKSKRAVQTASLWQVRQPIYNSSVNRWLPYAKHLEPLIRELGDVLSDEDYNLMHEAGLKLKRPGKFSLNRMLGW
ncbi:MAG: sulfotransferase [Candidatus Thiodiazotropha endolucinida]|nr:sulfotransferase [Candidatus Thiodiazotropha taylori]MCW4315002.1 sulfotransferase [Candidatus Thiodiazotropha taylori]